MASGAYDVVIVGGGIHGVCAAWEATRRGLRVALVEAEDFGHATTSNSLRTFHGGLRYLQQMDFQRMRESIRERREWLRIAPDLVKPMRFVLPTSGHGMRGRTVMRTALLANDLVSFDRNDGVWVNRHLPRSEVWSTSRALQVLAGTSIPNINGAATWHDAICLNTERLHIALVEATADAGAQVANYARALKLRSDSDGVRGVQVRDELNDREYDLRAPVVINAAGPWVDEWVTSNGGRKPRPVFTASKAFNLLARPLPFADALGLPCSSTYFAIPWNGRTLIGTRHLRCKPSTTTCDVTAEEVQAFLRDINGALGKHRIAESDVTGVFCGLLPEREGNRHGDVALVKTARVTDHGVEDGLPGLYSIVGIKWTTSRAVAERAVKMACDRICSTASATPDRMLTLQTRGADAPAVRELIEQNPALGERVVADLSIVKGQVVHAARSEMAVRLWDVVRRRVPLYLSDALDSGTLQACATLMAAELGWTRFEAVRQLDDTLAQLAAFHGPLRRGPEEQTGHFRGSLTAGQRRLDA
ncbi:MAG: FAD-dependent oxidoreductase [Gammaproteobacteria bacterium]